MSYLAPIPLPMSSEDCLRMVIRPALQLFPEGMRGVRAEVVMLTIAGQESDFRSRWQIVDPADRSKKGPARGLWQFEIAGVKGVMGHSASRDMAQDICEGRGVSFNARMIWEAFEKDDLLAACFARLLLWTDPVRLPLTIDTEGAWRLYIRTWRPGKARAHVWAINHNDACLTVGV